VRGDLEYLYKALEQAHYNLYVNTGKEISEREYQKIYKSINDSLTPLQITGLFQPFVATEWRQNFKRSSSRHKN
jgi:hypothetical protein